MQWKRGDECMEGEKKKVRRACHAMSCDASAIFCLVKLYTTALCESLSSQQWWGMEGAVLAGFLFKSSSISYSQAFVYIGVAIACVAAVVALVNFDKMRSTITEPATLETANS